MASVITLDLSCCTTAHEGKTLCAPFLGILLLCAKLFQDELNHTPWYSSDGLAVGFGCLRGAVLLESPLLFPIHKNRSVGVPYEYIA